VKLLDTYKKYKKDFPNSIILIESGEFYEALEEDAYILHFLLKYKILLKKKFIHVGFPKKMLMNVLSALEDFSVLTASGGRPI